MPRKLSFTERRDWLRLIRTQNVGPVSFRDLINRYGDAGAALDALPSLIRKKSINPPRLEQVEAEMEYAEKMGVRLICAVEPDYPKLLRALDPPPPIISVLGRVDLLDRPCVAIIGSRNASAIGQRFAHGIAAELGQAGYSVVSGLARGIDSAAHQGSLSTGTVAVLGGGIDHVYPRENAELHSHISENGAIVSESPLGYRATARDFPRRNRIISGLSRGVVVIEAAERSGTLITARYALEQNREVMAAPGSPLDPRTKGCNRLIRQGAHLIESADDVITVLESLRSLDLEEPKSSFSSVPFDASRAGAEITKAKSRVLGLLSPTPTPRDDIIRASGLPVPIVAAALLELELAGDAHVEPDGRMSLV
ncbi:MAG: DNA-processing protein DprA [Litorimonas sp.]